MNRMILAVCILTGLGLTAHTASSGDQASVMKCSPPKFMLVSEVDLNKQTLTGLSTLERHTPELVVSAFHRTIKLTDMKVTTARGEAVDEDGFQELKGRLVVVSEGRTPLSAAFLGLFRDDTMIVTIKPANE